MKDELGKKITKKFDALRAKRNNYLTDKKIEIWR